MNSSKLNLNPEHTIQVIGDYVSQSSGLRSESPADESVTICQQVDGKSLTFNPSRVDEVLQRTDVDGREFLQVNFDSGKKILITDNLIGFKPASCYGLDLKKLPKVVTTPDLISVVDAIEDVLSGEDEHNDEVEVLRRVFESVLRGAESVGFDLTSERVWLHQFFIGNSKASA